MTSSSTVCNICQGSGWKSVNGGAAKSVTRCDCTIQSRSGRLMKQSRIPSRYEHCEFDSYHPELGGTGREKREQALSTAKKFVQEYPLEKTGLILIGPIGVGKTHLAVSILRELILRKGIPGLFYDYRELLKQVQNSYNASVQVTEMDVLRPVFETELLVLDELGAVKPTEWVWDTVSHILNTRYNDKLTTIITTNFADQPPAAVAAARDLTSRATRDETLGDRIGERMRSRLHEMCRVVYLEGEDVRQKMRSGATR